MHSVLYTFELATNWTSFLLWFVCVCVFGRHSLPSSLTCSSMVGLLSKEPVVRGQLPMSSSEELCGWPSEQKSMPILQVTKMFSSWHVSRRWVFIITMCRLVTASVSASNSVWASTVCAGDWLTHWLVFFILLLFILSLPHLSTYILAYIAYTYIALPQL